MKSVGNWNEMCVCLSFIAEKNVNKCYISDIFPSLTIMTQEIALLLNIRKVLKYKFIIVIKILFIIRFLMYEILENKLFNQSFVFNVKILNRHPWCLV